jgi:hypothetical protein
MPEHKEKIMAVWLHRKPGQGGIMKPKSSSSALAALLFAGGLWAWRNRDKIQNWAETQRHQMNTPQSTDEPYTGQTRRIGETAADRPADTTTQRDSFAADI